MRNETRDEKTNSKVRKFENCWLVHKAGVFGLSVTKCRELVIEHKPYAQYDRATWLKYRGPRQRKWRQVVLSCDQQIAVFGHEVEFDNFNRTSETTAKGKYSSCDPRWADELDAMVINEGAMYRQDLRGYNPDGEPENGQDITCPNCGKTVRFFGQECPNCREALVAQSDEESTGTLAVGGREFEVEKNPDDDGKRCCLAYFLKGKRGAVYGLMRNVEHPDCLFAVNGKNGRSDPFPGTWFTDRDGVLRVL